MVFITKYRRSSQFIYMIFLYLGGSKPCYNIKEKLTEGQFKYWNSSEDLDSIVFYRQEAHIFIDHFSCSMLFSCFFIFLSASLIIVLSKQLMMSSLFVDFSYLDPTNQSVYQ